MHVAANLSNNKGSVSWAFCVAIHLTFLSHILISKQSIRNIGSRFSCREMVPLSIYFKN